MGKTDKLIVPIYKKMLLPHINRKIGFFGFTKDDKMPQYCKSGDFYDYRLGNWDINTHDWSVDKQYDIIVCLRTSCFSRRPRRMLENFHRLLSKDGILMIDWSLGSAHYPRKNPSWTWSWTIGNDRCYGIYNKNKCLVYSSCLTDKCLASKPFLKIVKYASKLPYYRRTNDWRKTIELEFSDELLLNDADLTRLFDVVKEKNWTPLEINGRAQLYTIQLLKKK